MRARSRARGRRRRPEIFRRGPGRSSAASLSRSDARLRAFARIDDDRDRLGFRLFIWQMEPDNASKDQGGELHHAPPFMQPDIESVKRRNFSPPIQLKGRVPMARPGLARKGKTICLSTNHFRASVLNINEYFFQYHVTLKYQDDQPVLGKAIRMKAISKMQEFYKNELGGKVLVFDADETLFTIGPLRQIYHTFTVILDTIPLPKYYKCARQCYQVKAIEIELKFATKFPMQFMTTSLNGEETEKTPEALRVLHTILRQHAREQGCLLVRQFFYCDNQKNYPDLGGGVFCCKGFHSTFRPVQAGLSLNFDVSTTLIVRPGPVIEFLLANQNVRNISQIDWAKARRVLKNLLIKKGNMEYKITGLSELPCNKQTFILKLRGDCQETQDNVTEITVFDYYACRGIVLTYSARLPCIIVGKPEQPSYFPMEFCDLVPLQRYKKSMTVQQRASLVEQSRQKPHERMSSITNALRSSNYLTSSMLRACGISINNNFVQVEGRVLQPPKLVVGNGEVFIPRNGRWSLSNKKFITPVKVGGWAVVNFSARCDKNGLINGLIRCGGMKGISFEQPLTVLEENPSMRVAPPLARVEDIFDTLRKRLSKQPHFLLCLLERKNSIIHAPWKRKCFMEFGIMTQCMAPTIVNDQFLTNVVLKINAKLGGLNYLLHLEDSVALPIISKSATLIMGMHVSHGFSGRYDQSVAAVVNSRQWPLISRYRASVRTQPPKVETIDSLFKPVFDGESTYDEGIIQEVLRDFYRTSAKRKPDQIIIFRGGVSESQFNQVLNVELDQILEACKFLDEQWCPKFTLIVAQKKHHTKFFLSGGSQDINVPPGTVVDKIVCHPRNYDFYMCSHAGMIGTSRPTHYHILFDENNLNPDDLQELVHSLSYVNQRSTTALSIVAPIYYAHLAASQVRQFINFDGMPETSCQGEPDIAPIPHLPEPPRLHMNVKSSMFFC